MVYKIHLIMREKIAPTLLIFIILAFLALVSCGKGVNQEKSFGKVSSISADTARIGQLLQANNLALLDDYLVLQNGSDGVEDFYFVYSYPGLGFLYSFGKRGRGPGEYMMPAIIKNTPGNVLGFRDHATDAIVFYEIKDSGAELVSSKILRSPDSDRFFWEINVMEDSTLLVKHQGDKKGATELWSAASGIVDSLPNTFAKLPRKLGKDYFTIFDDYLISAKGDRFALAYNMIDRIEFGEVRDGKLLIDSSVGADSTPDFHLYGDDSETEFSVDRNIIHYENLYAGNDYVYALYSGKRMDETEERHSSLIEIYSWDGTPVELLDLETPIAYIAVDENSRTVYGINPDMSDEMILVYRF